MNHTRKECRDPDCTGNCIVCNLFICTVCGGAEGTLPSECPGRRMTEAEESSVYAGKLNFRDGQWRDESSFGVSAHYKDGARPEVRS